MQLTLDEIRILIASLEESIEDMRYDDWMGDEHVPQLRRLEALLERLQQHEQSEVIPF